MRVLAVGLLAGILAGVLWAGGEAHRENCERAGRTECSVLPWNAGDTKPSAPLSPAQTRRQKLYGEN